MSKTWRKYQKTAIQEMRDYVEGEDLTGVSVAQGETPKSGGMIARDKQGSRWYVSPEFMSENYQEVDSLPDTQDQGWRDIESAPKDGKWLLLFPHFHYKKNPAIGYWFDGGWYLLDVGNLIHGWKPTRWKPLPAPPGDKKP